MTKTESTTIFIYEDSDWKPSESLEILCHFLRGKFLEIPKEFRDSAHVIIDSDCDEVYIEISYRRPFTDEEIEERKERERARIAHIEKENMDRLKKLSEQYGFRLVKKK